VNRENISILYFVMD